MRTTKRSAGVIRSLMAVLVGASCIASTSPDGDETPKGSVWVVNRDRGELAVFDAETGAVVETLAVGAGAHDICISEQAGKAYIAAEAINTVTAVDIKTLVTQAIDVGPLPHHLEPSPDGRTLVVSLRGTPATLAFVDTNGLTRIGTVQIAGAGTFGDLAVMTQNGRHVFATFDAGVSGTGGVALVDVRSRAVVATWAYPGTGRPHGIWYSRKKPRF